ncbi:ankyrin repeat-containing domain protein [Russula emetica]|nr:ankyrin repeat-containing domain protein [Russula emetica]
MVTLAPQIQIYTATSRLLRPASKPQRPQTPCNMKMRPLHTYLESAPTLRHPQLLRAMDRIAIAMEESARIRDKMPSAILNVASGTRRDSTADNDAPSNSGDAQFDIFTYARQGNVERIRAVIESGQASATDRNNDGITPLHLAAITGRVPVCAYLIDKGAEVNALGDSLPATPLQWAAHKGLVEIMDLLIQHGANPCLVDSQDFSCLHSVTHSSDYWALLYILCQPDIAVDERDNMGHTALHWAVYQRDEVSTQILLKMDANPKAVDRDGLTTLHWAAFNGNKGTKIGLTAQEIAAEYDNKDVWNSVVEELGLKPDGRRMRRPLSEPGVNIIAFSAPSISLCIAFTITSVFPLYMSIVLSPLALVAMHYVVIHELLRRNTISDGIWSSTYFIGVIIGTALWMAYAWVTRLRHDAPNNPGMHAAFLFLFVVFMLALLCTVFCDPGKSATQTKDALKPIIEDLVRGNRLSTEVFCIECMAVKTPHTKHCSFCKKCVTYRGTLQVHASWMLNCISVNNYVYFVVFILSLLAGVVMFDYLVWKHLLALKDVPLSSHPCVLPRRVCKFMSGDMFLISVSVWSTLQLVWGVVQYGLSRLNNAQPRFLGTSFL